MYSKSAPLGNRRVANIGKEESCNDVTNYDLLHKLHHTMKWKILIVSPGEGSHKHKTPLQEIYNKNKGYIIWLSKDADVLSMRLKVLTSYPNAWNSRAYFIIIVDEILPDPRQRARQIFKELLNFKVFNVIVLIPSRGGPRALDVYTWFPYQLPSGQCGEIKGTVILDQWIMEGRGRFLRNVYLFPPKIPRNLRGCNITAAIVPLEPFIMSLNKDKGDGNMDTYDEGSDIRLFLFVAEVMNVSVAFRFPMNTKEIWPFKLENGSWTGVLGDLIDKKADIAFCGFTMNLDKSVSFDATYVYDFSGLVWIVPCAEPFLHWKSIIRVFSAQTWSLLFVFLTISAIFMYSLSNCQKNIVTDVGAYRSLSDCFYNVWAVFLGMSVTRMPLTDHLKVYFVMFLWYCLAINIVFQALVTSYILQPEYQTQIASVKDILSSGIEYGFYPDLSMFFPESSDWRFKKILSNRIPCYGDTCIRRAIEKNDFATITDSIYAEYMRTYVSYNKNVLCSFKQAYMTKMLAMFLQKGSFLTENVKRLVGIAVEAGLHDLWKKNILYTLKVRAQFFVRMKLMEDYRVLLLTHLQGSFYLLQLGYGLSFITFLGELLYHKQRSKMNSLKSKIYKHALPAITYKRKRRMNIRRIKLEVLTNERS
jgi:hypothetical protein